MKRSVLALALVAVSGSSSALTFGGVTFGSLSVRDSAATFLSGSPTFPGGFAGSAPFFVTGDTVQGFESGRNGFSGFAVVLTSTAPRLAGLGLALEQSFLKTYDSLLPLYVAIDPPLMRLSAPAAPVAVPLGAAIVEGASRISAALRGTSMAGGAARPSLPGLEGLAFR